MSWHCHPTGSPWLAGALGTVSKQPCATPPSMAVQPRDRPVPSDPLPSPQGDPGVADEPPDTGTQGARAVGCKGVPTPRGLSRHGWGKHPSNKSQGKLGHLCPGNGKGSPGCARRWLVLTLAPAQQKSLPPPACSPRWSAAAPFPPQRVCLPLALISCTLSPPPLPPSPVHPRRAPHSQAPRALPPTPCLSAQQTSPHTSQLLSLMLCAPLRSRETRVPPHRVSRGVGWRQLGQHRD